MCEFELNKVFKNLDLGIDFYNAKESLKDFGQKINELKTFNNDNIFIHEYFSTLRNEIDIDREKIKLLIDEHYLKLIGQIDDIEAKCNEKSGDTNQLIDEQVNKLDETMQSFCGEMNKLKIDFENWENIRVGSNSRVKIVNGLIEKFKNDLLMQLSYEYESNTDLFDAAIKTSKIVATKSQIKLGIIKF